MRLCGAKTRSGEPCKGKAMPNSRCRMHGGKSPVGMAVNTFKDGRYSKYLPTRLNERYQEARTDPDLLALREDIALVDSRLSDLLKRVDTGESGGIWQQLQQAFAEFGKARGKGDVPGMTARLGEVEALITRGLADYAAWEDVGKTLDRRQKLVESERKRLVEMQQVITTTQAMILLAAVVETVKRNVTDKRALAAISADLARLVASPGIAGASAGG